MKRKKFGRKEKKKAKEIKKKKKREIHAMDFIKSMEKRGEPNGKIKKKKKKWDEATTERKDDMQKRVWRNTKTKPAQSQGERREREVKIRKKYCRLPKTNTCRLTKWFSMFALSRPAKHDSMLPCHALTCCQDMGSKTQAEHEEPLRGGGLTFSQMPEQGAVPLTARAAS